MQCSALLICPSSQAAVTLFVLVYVSTFFYCYYVTHEFWTAGVAALVRYRFGGKRPPKEHKSLITTVCFKFYANRIQQLTV